MSCIHQFAAFAVSFAVVLSMQAARNFASEPGSAPVEFAQGDGRVTIAIDGLPVAMYCYQDDKITRPFFAHVRARNGVQVTRHHPPVEGQDLTDHGTFHPGICAGKGSFAVRNQYIDQKNPAKVACNELARYTFLVRPEGTLLLWDSTFTSDHEFTFGDQEEMGLGFRVATPLRVGKSGDGNVPPGNGGILDSKGRKNGEQIGGNSAEWCDFSGTIAGERVGITLFCHPDNFRPSWFHARDYGFLEANPFGRQAFGKGEKSSVVVRPGEELRLRYGLLIHSGPPNTQPDYSAAYQDYLQIAGK